MITHDTSTKPDWSRFKYVGVVCFTGYQARKRQLEQELSRVGIKDPVYHWDFPSPYKDLLLNKVPMTKFNKRNGSFFIGLNNYRAISTAYYIGHESCLIMEDDVRFLKDLSKLREIVDSLPSDFDLAMFDHNKPCALTWEGYLSLFGKDVSEPWCRFEMLTSCGCYALSRRCMKKLIDLFDAPACGRGKLYNSDHYFRRGFLGNEINMYAARIPAAIQKQFSSMHTGSLENYYKLRHQIGADKSMYNL